eukprot:TRINITY_DN8075_c0_g1_i1.p1 TRINITY_DN8075_c0_g1~~TRINITY_DN8075_c0_g1_i1.p1  ORF type:complete len:1348 (-),score=277.24 TRINITY_DN8075_c0_g1_i1:226-4269(-)
MDRIFDGIDEEFASKYKNIFVEQHIGLAELAHLNHELLNGIGLKKLGHRIRILNNIKALIPNTSQKSSLDPAPRETNESDQEFLQLPQSVVYDIGSNGKSPERPEAATQKTKPKQPKPAAQSGSTPDSTKPSEKSSKRRRSQPDKKSSRSAASAAVIDSDATPEPAKTKAPRFEPILTLTSRGTPEQPGNKLNLGAQSLEMSPLCYASIDERNQLLAEFGVLLGSGNDDKASSRDPPQQQIDDPTWPMSCISAPQLPISELQNRSQEAISTMINNLFSRYKPPRRHQLTALTKLIVDLVLKACGGAQNPFSITKHTNYLLQHAAGSGKTLTISALVDVLHRLVLGSRYLYDLVLVICDRIELVEQLHAVLSNFLRAQNRNSAILATATSSTELTNLISTAFDSKHGSPLRIITTTMQKFGQLSMSDDNMRGRRIAVVADEAHRSHGQEYTRRMHDVLTGETQQNENITYFSFTCTPLGHALKAYGTPSKDINHDQAPTRMRPFHTYSMKQAVADGVVLDVLKNFSSVRIGVDYVARCAEEKVYGEGTTACIALIKEGDYSPQVLAAKARYIVEHFDEVRKKHAKNGFVPKAMLVASSREQVLIYRNAITHAVTAYLPPERQFEAIAVFSPISESEEKADRGSSKKTISETDVQVNAHNAAPFPTMLANFQSPRSRIHMVIVADKLQTGFDEPALTAMYIDKYINGVTAVQTLGRLSRPSLGKDNIYVVDFVNNPRDIVDSFATYWGETTTIMSISSKTRKMDVDQLLEACQLLSTLPGIMMRDTEVFVNHFFDDSVTEYERSVILKKLDLIKKISSSLQIDVGMIPVTFVNRIQHAIIAEGKRRLEAAHGDSLPHGSAVLDDVDIVVKSVTILAKDEPLNTADLPDAAKVAADPRSYSSNLSNKKLFEQDASRMSLKDILSFVQVVKQATMTKVNNLVPPVSAVPVAAPALASEGLTPEDFTLMKDMMVGSEIVEIISDDQADLMEVDTAPAEVPTAASSSTELPLRTSVEVIDLTQEDSEDILIEEESDCRDRPDPILTSSPKRRKLSDSDDQNHPSVDLSLGSGTSWIEGPRGALRWLQELTRHRFPQPLHAQHYKECFHEINGAMLASSSGSDIDTMLRESGAELVGLAAQILNLELHEFADTLLEAVKFLLHFFTTRSDDLRSQFPYGDILRRAALILHRPGPMQQTEIASQTLRLVHFLMERVSDDCIRLMIGQSSPAFRRSLADSFCSYNSKTESDKRVSMIALEVIYKCASVEYDFLRTLEQELPFFKKQINLRAETIEPSNRAGSVIKKMKELLLRPPKPTVEKTKIPPPPPLLTSFKGNDLDSVRPFVSNMAKSPPSN